MTEAALRDIIRYYTREAGVRSLEREVSKICRKVVKLLLLEEGRRHVGEGRFGQPRQIPWRASSIDFGLAGKEDQVGQVTGLAWTGSGRRSADHRSRADAGQGQHHPHAVRWAT
ncbi:hypothetical protein ACU4HD_11040 [Cupriavidus basilensis]